MGSVKTGDVLNVLLYDLYKSLESIISFTDVHFVGLKRPRAEYDHLCLMDLLGLLASKFPITGHLPLPSIIQIKWKIRPITRLSVPT